MGRAGLNLALFFGFLMIDGVFVQEKGICESHEMCESDANQQKSQYFVSSEDIPKCPPEFTDASNICYMLTPPSAFPPKCPFLTVVPFDIYKNIVSIKGTPIWLPVKRQSATGLMEWVEVSSLYKSEFLAAYDLGGSTGGKDCLLYHNSSYTAAVPCEEPHSGVCAYYKLDELSNNPLCSSFSTLCRQSDFSPTSKCFCLGNSYYDQNEFPNKAQFVKPYQNTVYATLTADECTIGLEKINGTYVWKSLGEKIQYYFWNPNAVFGDSYVYGASTITGWILTEQPLNCFIFETPPQELDPKLNLAYSESDDRAVLQLKITDPEGLRELDSGIIAYCFTTASASRPVYKYGKINMVHKEAGVVIHEFEPCDQGPGYYWCEGFNYVNLEPVESERLFVNQSGRFGPEFVAIFNVTHTLDANPLLNSNITLLETGFSIELGYLTYVYIPRIMKIIDVDLEDHTVSINVHFTRIRNGTFKEEQEEKEEEEEGNDEMEILEAVIHNRTKELININLYYFGSATYCSSKKNYYSHPGNVSTLTWPNCPVNQSVQSEEYCFKDGIPVRRACIGDYEDVPRWESLDVECEIPETSPVTPQLLKIQDNPEDVNEILKLWPDFNTFDAFLLGRFIKKCLQSDPDQIDAATFEKILDGLLKVDEGILKESQEEMRTMDIILDAITDINFLENITSENFLAIFSVDSVVLLDNGDLIEIEGMEDMPENLEVAIKLARKPLDAVMYKFFSNPVFFSDVEYTHKIVGVNCDGKSDHIQVEILFGINNRNNLEQECAYWGYDLEDPDGYGKWNSVGPAVNSSTFLSCVLTLELASAVTLLTRSSTGDLELLLKSDVNSSEIIRKLSTISDRYREFGYRDVCLVGQILDKVSDDGDLDLTQLAHIINNMHEIDHSVLWKSQSAQGATDMILHSIDKILQNHQYHQKSDISTKNFKILIVNLEEVDFSGLILLANDEILQTEVLEGEVDTDSVVGHTNVTSVLLLTSNLKQQLERNATVKITIFSHDALFKENKTEPPRTSHIFGVILPYLEEYQGPIKILHRISTGNYDSLCVYWCYGATENTTGLWKQDNPSGTLSAFSQCDFWHTTNFALLLLEQDLYPEDTVLQWITSINCGLSVFGLSGIILTAILFKRWRTNSGNQILLNFVCALLIQILVFYVSNSANKIPSDYLTCTAVGVVLHYSIISQFCWMFIIAILQFKRYVEVLTPPPRHVLLKGCLCGWGLPCLPVACVYFVDNDNYVSGHVGLCYPSDLGLFLGIWLPITIIMAINLVIFVYIIYNVVHKKTECTDVGSNDAMFQWRLAIMLFFMLGLTWCFGFLSMEVYTGRVFVYLFCVTATLQGFMMFLFFIVFNSNTRYLYSHAVKKLFYAKNV